MPAPVSRSNAEIIRDELKRSGVDSQRANKVAESCVSGAKSPGFMTPEQKTILQTSFGKDLRGNPNLKSPTDVAGTAPTLTSAAYAPGSTVGFKAGGYKPTFGPTVVAHDMNINGAANAKPV
jgi:hypothetical protein